jgi:hypothetical protein
VRVVPTDAPPFAAIDAGCGQSIPASVFAGDSFGGVFASSPWYRYNITGIDNQIWPVFNVYLIKRGTAVYKVQLTGYYAVSGAARNITIRYARLRD